MKTVSLDWAYTLHLPHDARAPRIARTTLRAVLNGHTMSDLADTAELVASEMVTNAYRHTGGPSAMRLHGTPGRLRISVSDTHPTIPPPFNGLPCAPVAVSGDGGMGLGIVERCADGLGGHWIGDDAFGVRGKLLWIDLAHPDGFAVAA